ncbi:PilZ domain-containing protein [Acidobacteriota bacterium]
MADEKHLKNRRQAERQELPVEVRFADQDTFEREFCRNISYGGMFIATEKLRSPQSQIEITIYLPGVQEPLNLKAEVVHVQNEESPGGAGMGIQFLENLEEVQKKIGRFYELMQAGKAPAKHERAVLEKAEFFNQRAYIDTLSLTDKLHLALYGGREIRQLLLRDKKPLVHRYVLRNRKITPEEVAAMAGNPSIGSDMIVEITKKAEWLGNAKVRSALARHPKIPLPFLQKMVRMMPLSELQILAKGGSVRAQVAGIARNEIARRDSGK